MTACETSVEETVANPERVVQSQSDSHVRLYYRHYLATPVGAKFLCVVVKAERNDPFVITAYLTDRMKKGEIVWPAKS